METPVFDSEEGDRVNVGSVRAEAGEKREAEESMGHRTAERSLSREFMIDVQRTKITAQASEVDDIGLGDGARLAFPAVADVQFIKMQLLHRGFLFVVRIVGGDCPDNRVFGQDRKASIFASLIGTSFAL